MWSQHGGSHAHQTPKIVQQTSALCWLNGTASFSFAEASSSTFQNFPSLIKDAAEVVAVTDDMIPRKTNSFPKTILKIQTSVKMKMDITGIHGTDSPLEVNPNREGIAIECIILRSNTFPPNTEELLLASPQWVDIKEGSPEQFDRCVLVKYCTSCVFDNGFPCSRSFLVYCLCLRAYAGLMPNKCTSVMFKCIQRLCAIYLSLSLYNNVSWALMKSQ